jgi:alkanesulfonate monooxygenase SsuD/methylene tetrahydromethanopterin reductase-like flavin-dependent oxidoreductase (luciferase family)
MKLDLGYFLNPEYPPKADLAQAIAEQQQTVALCRDLGMKAVVVGEHFSRETSVWLPPLMLLSRLCEHGRGMLFGTGVLVAPLHRPIVLAEQAAFLDVLTEGNFALGLSAGWNRAEFESMGVPTRGRGGRLEETVEILRLLWKSDEPVSYAGTHCRLDETMLSLKPVQRGGPPIWIGASSDVGLRRAARIGDAWIASSHLSNDEVVAQAETFGGYRKEFDRELPRVRPGLRNIYVAPTLERAVREAGPHLTSSYSMFKDWGLFAEVLREGSGDVDFDKAAQRAIIGSPELVAEQIVKFVRHSGVNLLLVRVQWLGIEHRHINSCLELMASEVLPLVQSELASTATT